LWFCCLTVPVVAEERLLELLTEERLEELPVVADERLLEEIVERLEELLLTVERLEELLELLLELWLTPLLRVLLFC